MQLPWEVAAEAWVTCEESQKPVKNHGVREQRPHSSGRSRSRNNSQEPCGKNFENKVALLNAVIKMPTCPFGFGNKRKLM